jgi:hypothetical protein
MTTFSASLTNHTVLHPQSRNSSHHVLEAKCPPQPTHLPLLQRVNSTDDLVPQKGPGSLLLIFLLLMRVSARIWAPPMLQLQKHSIYLHKTLCTIPTYNMSLGLLTVGVPEAGDFVGSLVLYVHGVNLVASPYNQCSSCIIRSVRVKSCPYVWHEDISGKWSRAPVMLKPFTR